MTKRVLIAVFAALLIVPASSSWVAAAEAAQQRTPPAPPPPPPPAPPAQPAPAPPEAPAPPPAPQGQPNANVQLDVVITDTVSGTPDVKQVTLLIQSGRNGSIRTDGQVWVPGNGMRDVQLALDGRVATLGSGLVQVGVTFEYEAPPETSEESSKAAVAPPSRITESLTAVLRSGRPLVVSRSADPVTNRTVTVELTATIMEP